MKLKALAWLILAAALQAAAWCTAPDEQHTYLNHPIRDYNQGVRQ